MTAIFGHRIARRRRYGARHYPAIAQQFLHGVPFAKVRAAQPAIWVEYKIHDLPTWTREKCKTMGVALSIANSLIENFARARIIWEAPR